MHSVLIVCKEVWFRVLFRVHSILEDAFVDENGATEISQVDEALLFV